MTDSKTATELLPCPFCGGEGEIYSDYSSERDECRWQVWHVCDDGPKGESAGYGQALHTSIDTPWFKSREQAIEAWNTRTPEQAIAATLGSGECEWVLEHSGTLYDKWRCSKCGYLFVEPRCDQGYRDLEPNFCPNCGKAVKR